MTDELIAGREAASMRTLKAAPGLARLPLS